jgi:cob(I)alamin adenosyltransferase
MGHGSSRIDDSSGHELTLVLISAGPPAVWGIPVSGGGGGGGGAVTAIAGAFVDGAITTIGTEADAANTNPATSGTLMSYIKGLLSKLGSPAQDSTVTAVTTELTTMAGGKTLATLDTDLGTINTTLGTTNTDLGTINTSVGAVTTELTTMAGSKTLATLDTDLQTINTTLGTTNTDVAAVTTELQTIAASKTLATLDTDIQAVTTELTTMAGGKTLATLDTDLGTVNTSLGTINTSIGTTNSDLTTINTNLATNGIVVKTMPSVTVSGTVTSNDGGSNITGVTLPSGSGLTGWLSYIYNALVTAGIKVTTLPSLVAGSAAIGTVGVTSLPGSPAQDATVTAVTTELTTLAASTTLAQLLTALGSGGAITTELSTLAASKTLATLDTDLLALIAQNNSAYPTGKTPFFYQAVALAGIVTITIPAVAAKLINITNMSIMVSTAAILSPTVNIIQDIAGTPVQMWEGAVAVSAVNEVIHENFNPPLQSNIANKTVTFNMGSLGAAVYGFININGYYSAS